MNKLTALVVGLALTVLPVAAQSHVAIDFDSWDDFNRIEISNNDRHVETSLNFALPMYFGWSTLTETSPDLGGPWALMNGIYPGNEFDRVGLNFVYEIEMVNLHVRYKRLNLSAGLRWTFMDFAFGDATRTFSTKSDGVYWPVPISDPAYDFKKSKLHASYLGVPVRLGVNFGLATLYAGASIEMRTEGYAKYRNPRTRTSMKDAFNPVRATVEAGFSYANFGVFVQYGLTPFFAPEYSPAKTLTFGLTLGI